MKKIMVLFLVCVLSFPLVFAESDVRDIDLKLRIEVKDEMSIRIFIETNVDEYSEPFSWSNDGDDDRWELEDDDAEIRIDGIKRKINDVIIKAYAETETSVRIVVHGYDESDEYTFSWGTDDDYIEGNYNDIYDDGDWFPMYVDERFDFTDEEANIGIPEAMLNLSRSQTTLTNSMNDMIGYINDTRITDEYAVCIDERGVQKGKLENMQGYKEQAEQYDSCNTDFQTMRNNYKTCNTEKIKLEESGKSNPFLFIAVGFAICYFWKQEKEAVPQEFTEMGSGQMPPPPMFPQK